MAYIYGKQKVQIIISYRLHYVKHYLNILAPNAEYIFGDFMTKFSRISNNLTRNTLIFILSVLIFRILLLMPVSGDGLYSIKIFDNKDELIYETTNMYDSTFIKLDSINQYSIDAFTSIEDKFFYDHYGVNPLRTIKAFISNLLNNEISEGGSTITQQLAKNMYLTSEKSYIRKIKETYIAFKLEAQMSKDEIMELYLNTLYFGHGIYGINDASYFYFDKDVSEITLNESAMLAAIINGPEIYSPLNNLENSIVRKNLVLKMMLGNKKINYDQYTENISVSPKIHGKSNRQYISPLLYYKGGVLEELNTIKLPANSSEICIYTGYDANINIYIDNLLKTANIDYQSAIVLLNNTNHLYESVVGGNDYYKSSYNRAVNENRQVGSTLKPFLYVNAIERGVDADTMLLSEKTTFYINGDQYTPSNYGDKFENEKISMAYALAVSDNIYAVKMHLYLGQETLVNTLSQMDYNVKSITPSLALGTTEIPLSTLSSMYSTFANNGYYTSGNYIRYVTANSKNIYDIEAVKTKVFSETSNFVMIDLLENTFDTTISQESRVTGSSISHLLKNRFAAKSGSTDYDNYFIGFNPDITISVWNGYDSTTEIENSTFTKLLWKDIANKYMSDKAEIWFNEPVNVVKAYAKITESSSGYFDFYKTDSRPKK